MWECGEEYTHREGRSSICWAKERSDVGPDLMHLFRANDECCMLEQISTTWRTGNRRNYPTACPSLHGLLLHFPKYISLFLLLVLPRMISWGQRIQNCIRRLLSWEI